MESEVGGVDNKGIEEVRRASDVAVMHVGREGPSVERMERVMRSWEREGREGRGRMGRKV